MFAFRDRVDGVEVAFTDATLDLRADSPRLPSALRAVADVVGVPLAWAVQIHGTTVVTVDDALSASQADGLGEADALVAATTGVGLMVRVADCVPVLLADPQAGVVGAVHAGRRGMAAGIVATTLERMRDLGAASVRAWVGPHICGRCYEVPSAMRSEVCETVPAAFAETAWGTPALDIGAGVTSQLTAAGVSVVQLDRCTREDERFPSYRRDGASAGRFAGLVWMP